jgi:nucleoside-diphosphate-sugar epimerase
VQTDGTIVLVTGASGFLGQAMVPRLLGLGHRVIGLDVVPAPTTQVIDDLSDPTRLHNLIAREKISHIIHAGGVSGPMVLADAPARVIAINVTGSLNLLQAALDEGAATFIYCSSVSALGNYYEDAPIGDDYPLRPTTTYGCSKAAMDMVLRGLYGRVPLDLGSLRFTAIYGPGRKTQFIIDKIIAAALAGKAAELEPLTDWPYIYIDDAADAAIAACFAAGRKQLNYYIAHPDRVTPDDLAAASAACGYPVRIAIDQSRPKSSRGPLDVRPAERDFGFRAKIDHTQGIRRMIEAAMAPRPQAVQH